MPSADGPGSAVTLVGTSEPGPIASTTKLSADYLHCCSYPQPPAQGCLAGQPRPCRISQAQPQVTVADGDHQDADQAAEHQDLALVVDPDRVSRRHEAAGLRGRTADDVSLLSYQGSSRSELL